jgi:large subunit ribosomal protein L3
MKYMLCEKFGMSQMYGDNGAVLPVTLLKAGPLTVTQVKTKETDGYDAVQVGYGAQKPERVSKPVRGHVQKAAGEGKAFRVLREAPGAAPEGMEPGATVDVSAFTVGEKVDVKGTSKGKGFQGVVKRYNFRGGWASHGGKHNLRQPGSIGAQQPQRVLKGKKMAGRMGSDRIVVHNLVVAHVDPKQHIIAVKGAVPGARGSLVEIFGKETK